MGKKSRRIRTRAMDPPTRRPSDSDRHQLDSGCKDAHHDLPWSTEQRNWAAIPRDVLCIILSFLPQADILRGAGLVCAWWRRLAHQEPLLWRRIDLAAATDKDEVAPARWQAIARAAVRRSAGGCESFRGRVNGKFLLFLAQSAPSLQGLHVTSRFNASSNKLITAVAKKLHLLEQLVMSDSMFYQASSLAPFVDHCPRLHLLDSGGCGGRTGRTLRAMVEARNRISGWGTWPSAEEEGADSWDDDSYSLDWTYGPAVSAPPESAWV